MTYSSVVLALSPIWWGRLGESSGTTLVDSSGNGRDGTLTGITLGATGALTGDTDTAWTLPGASTAHGDVTYASWMDCPTAFSVVAWIKTTGSGFRSIVDRDHTTLGRVWQFRQNSANVEFLKISGGVVTSSTSGSGITMNDGAWHLVAATYDGSNIRMYADGSLVKTTAAAGSLTGGAPLTVGANRSGGGGAYVAYWLGDLDEPALFNTVLTGTQIADIYTAGTTAPATTGSFAITLPAPTVAFAGSYVPPDETGSFAVTLPVPVAAFDGTYQAPPTGSFAIDLPVPVVAFDGTYTPPPDPTGSFAITLPTPVVEFAGTYFPHESGTFAIDLPVPVAEFAGTYTPAPITGSFDITLPLPVVEFSGLSSAAIGSFAIELPLPTVQFEGSYGGPYPTETSNLFDGLNLVCLGYVTLARADVVPPTAPPKYDKALPYPEPVMVEGRPT